MNADLLALASIDAFELLHRAFMRVGALDPERRRAWDAIEHAQSFVLRTGISSGRPGSFNRAATGSSPGPEGAPGHSSSGARKPCISGDSRVTTARRRNPAARWPLRVGQLLLLALTASLASAQPCDVRPDLPVDTARRILAACLAEREHTPEPAEESALFRALGIAQYPAKLADFASTEVALSRGGYEANPLMTSRSVRVATTVAVPAFVNWSSAKLYRRHPKWATTMRVIGIGIPVALAANNLSLK